MYQKHPYLWYFHNCSFSCQSYKKLNEGIEHKPGTLPYFAKLVDSVGDRLVPADRVPVIQENLGMRCRRPGLSWSPWHWGTASSGPSRRGRWDSQHLHSASHPCKEPVFGRKLQNAANLINSLHSSSVASPLAAFIQKVEFLGVLSPDTLGHWILQVCNENHLAMWWHFPGNIISRAV